MRVLFRDNDEDELAVISVECAYYDRKSSSLVLSNLGGGDFVCPMERYEAETIMQRLNKTGYANLANLKFNFVVYEE